MVNGTTESHPDTKAEESHPDTKAEAQNVEPVDVPPSAAQPVGETSTVEEVRQGHTGDHVRYILTVSALVAAVVLIGLAVFWAV